MAPRWELHVWVDGERAFAHWWDLPAAVGWARTALSARDDSARVWALANWALAANLDPYTRLFRAPRTAATTTAPPSLLPRVSPALTVPARREVIPKRFGLFPLNEWRSPAETVRLVNLFSGNEDDTWQFEQRLPLILRALGATFGNDLLWWIKAAGELPRVIAIPDSAVTLSIRWQPVVFGGHYEVSWAVREPIEAALMASSQFRAVVQQPYGNVVNLPNACAPTMAEIAGYYLREVEDFARAPHAFVGTLYAAIVEKNADTIRQLLPTARNAEQVAALASASRDLASRFAGLAVERANALRRENALRTAESVIELGRGLASVAGPIGAGVGSAVGALAELTTRAAVATGAADLSEEETMRVFASMHYLPHSGSVRGTRSYHRAPSQTFAEPPGRESFMAPRQLLRLDERERPIYEVLPSQYHELAPREERKTRREFPVLAVGGAFGLAALALYAATR